VPTRRPARRRGIGVISKPNGAGVPPDRQQIGKEGNAARTEQDRIDAVARSRHRLPLAQLLEREPTWALDFDDLSFEWRRLFSEVFGTFLLVLAGAGAPVVDAVSHGQIGRSAAVVAPALTVLAVILFMGAVSGAHLNPVVSIAFALRGDFGWRRVPGYVGAQLFGALLAALLLRATFGDKAHLGATLPGPGFSSPTAFVIEAVLTLGLVSTVLGTASSAQNLGPISAFGVAGYIAVAGLWASPVSGASMNPARSLGPAILSSDAHDLWIYLTAPLVGALIAVATAQILRGPGGGPTGSRAAQGTLDSPTTRHPE
jgi:aquaporin Z